MYTSLIHPWSPPHLITPAEEAYRLAGLLRTKGTIFLLPPPPSILSSTYNSPPRPKTRMSAGAVALCKHFERGGASSEHGRPHPYWSLPRGSNDRKSEIAGEVLERMMREVVWRNVMLLHAGVAVYEVRNLNGYGMRWTLEVEEVNEGEGSSRVNADTGGNGGRRDGVRDDGSKGITENDAGSEDREKVDVVLDNPLHEADLAGKEWRIIQTTFRGFVEPIEGMDHELDST